MSLITEKSATIVSYIALNKAANVHADRRATLFQQKLPIIVIDGGGSTAITGEQLVAGLIYANGDIVLPSAADVLAALGTGVQLGDAFDVALINGSLANYSLTLGEGMLEGPMWKTTFVACANNLVRIVITDNGVMLLRMGLLKLAAGLE
jgi:hypothetical protein